MALFKPYDNGTNSPATSEPASVPQAAKNPTKKQVPTPTRKQAEQARRDRIQPVLTKREAKLKEKEARYKALNETNAKVAARPVNTLIRDWVDHRWNLSEFAIPVMLLIFVAMMVAGYLWPAVVLVLPWLVYAVAILMVVDVAVMWLGLRHQVQLYFPGEPMKGKLSYAFSRAMLFRRSRQPAPRVKRGSKFVWPNPEDK